MRTFAHALALAVAVAVTGCGDDETTEPLPSGPSVVSASVDGVSWTSGVPTAFGEPDTSIAILEFPLNDTTRALIVRATRRSNDDPDGSLLVLGFYGRFRPPQTFALDPAPDVIDLGVPPPRTLTWAVWVDSLADTSSFVTDATHRGTLTFSRYDETSAILEGQFEFEGVHQESGDSVTVTGGRFVLEMKPASRRTLPWPSFYEGFRVGVWGTPGASGASSSRRMTSSSSSFSPVYEKPIRS